MTRCLPCKGCSYCHQTGIPVMLSVQQGTEEQQMCSSVLGVTEGEREGRGKREKQKGKKEGEGEN